MSSGMQAPARDLSIVMPVYNERNTILRSQAGARMVLLIAARSPAEDDSCEARVARIARALAASFARRGTIAYGDRARKARGHGGRRTAEGLAARRASVTVRVKICCIASPGEARPRVRLRFTRRMVRP